MPNEKYTDTYDQHILGKNLKLLNSCIYEKKRSLAALYALDENLPPHLCFSLTMIAIEKKNLDLLHILASLKKEEIDKLVEEGKLDRDTDGSPTSFFLEEIMIFLKKLAFLQKLHGYRDRQDQEEDQKGGYTQRTYSKLINHKLVHRYQFESKDLRPILSALLEKCICKKGIWRIGLNRPLAAGHSIAIDTRQHPIILYECGTSVSDWMPTSMDAIAKHLKECPLSISKITIDLIQPELVLKDIIEVKEEIKEGKVVKKSLAQRVEESKDIKRSFHHRVNEVLKQLKVEPNLSINYYIAQYDRDLISRVDLSKHIIYLTKNLTEDTLNYFANLLYGILTPPEYYQELISALKQNHSQALKLLLNQAHLDTLKSLYMSDTFHEAAKSTKQLLRDTLQRRFSSADLDKNKVGSLEMAKIAAQRHDLAILSLFSLETLKEVQKSPSAATKALIQRVVLNKLSPRYPLEKPTLWGRLISNFPTPLAILQKISDAQWRENSVFFPEITRQTIALPSGSIPVSNS